jgi:hypothetical protein
MWGFLCAWICSAALFVGGEEVDVGGGEHGEKMVVEVSGLEVVHCGFCDLGVGGFRCRREGHIHEFSSIIHLSICLSCDVGSVLSVHYRSFLLVHN